MRGTFDVHFTYLSNERELVFTAQCFDTPGAGQHVYLFDEQVHYVVDRVSHKFISINGEQVQSINVLLKVPK